jgi:hypothetical protein
MARRMTGPETQEREAERAADEERAGAEHARQERLRRLDEDHESVMQKYGRRYEDLFRRRRSRNGS